MNVQALPETTRVYLSGGPLDGISLEVRGRPAMLAINARLTGATIVDWDSPEHPHRYHRTRGRRGDRVVYEARTELIELREGQFIDELREVSGRPRCVWLDARCDPPSRRILRRRYNRTHALGDDGRRMYIYDPRESFFLDCTKAPRAMAGAVPLAPRRLCLESVARAAKGPNG